MPRIDSRLFACLSLFGLLLLASGCANVRQLDSGNSQGEASAELFVPYQFQVQAIDGTVLRDSFNSFDGRDQNLRVAPGKHELVLRYFDLIENTTDRTDDYSRVLSEPITVTFQARANSRYAVVGERPETPVAGETFAAEPQLTIENRGSGKTVSGEVSVAKAEAETIRRGNTVYAPVAKASTATGVSAAPGPQPAPENAPPQSLQMLKYWWNSASQAERDRFEAWRTQGAQ
jgi:uncharacterized protein YccT (UPF0319 family)